MRGLRQTIIVVLLFLGTVAMYDGSRQLQEHNYALQVLQDAQDQCATLEQLNERLVKVHQRIDYHMNVLTDLTNLLGRIVDLVDSAHQRIDYHMNVLIELTRPFDLSVLDSCGIITDGYGHGSCVAIGPDLVLTAAHCLGHGQMWVEIGGKRYDILEEWKDERYDVGFVRVDADLPYLELGRRPQLLDEVYLVGAPADAAFLNNVSKGVVTNLGVDVFDDVFDASCQIVVDTSGWFGNSGGPLVDANGGVIGVASFIPARECDNIIVCVPVHQIRSALRSYCANTL